MQENAADRTKKTVVVMTTVQGPMNVGEMSAGGDGGESNSPSRTRSPRTSYRYFRPTYDFALRTPDRRGASLAIR